MYFKQKAKEEKSGEQVKCSYISVTEEVIIYRVHVVGCGIRLWGMLDVKVSSALS